MTVNTAYVVTYSETDDYGDSITEVKAMGTDKERVFNTYLDLLPSKVMHWSMRYDYWTQETLDKFLSIVPDMDKRPHILIAECYPYTFCDEDEGKEEFKRYTLEYNYESADLDPADEPLLTREQKIELEKLFGSSWMPSRHTSHEYKFQKVALVPIG
jgi:hypothetical protein